MNAAAVTASAMRPNNLPWCGVRQGHDSYVWFEIHDCNGTVLLTTEKVYEQDQHIVFNQVLFVIAQVNENDLVKINGEYVHAMWRP